MPTVEQFGHQGCASCTTINQTINLGVYANALLIVGVSINNNDYEYVETLTWNGTPLTKLGDCAYDDDSRVEIWYLADPDIGNYTLSCTFDQSLNDEAIVGYLVVSGVDQLSPVGTFEYDAAKEGNPVTIYVPSAVGDLVFVVCCGETVDGWTAGTGLTEYWNDNLLNNTYAAGATKPGEAATTEVVYTKSFDDHHAVAGVAIKPAAAAGGGQPMSLRGKQVPFLRSW